MNRIALILLGCSASLPALAMPNLQGTEWQLVSPKAEGKAPTLRFDEGKISGFAGCNRFILSQQDGKNQVATTRMLCPPPMMRTEQGFLKLLSAPFRILPDGKAQHLTLKGEGGEYRFERFVSQPENSGKMDAVRPMSPLAAPIAPLPDNGLAYRYVRVGACGDAAACLEARAGEDQPWARLAGGIDGFKPEAGVTYYLKLRGAPQLAGPGQGPVRWTLERVVFSETATRQP